MFRRAAGIWAKIAGAHRSDDETGAGVVTEFFLPRLNRGFLLRMAVVALLAGVTFGFVLIPCVINGESMVPTYPAKGFTFCWRGKYLFGKPKRGDVVILRYADRVYFLKRIVGLPGDTIEFRNGTLYVTYSGTLGGEAATQAAVVSLYDDDGQEATVKLPEGAVFIKTRVSLAKPENTLQ